MRVEPISESKPHAKDFEIEARSGKVQYAVKGSRKGWRIHLGREAHDVLLPSSMRGKLSVDGKNMDIPRFGLRKTIPFLIDGHKAILEMWMTFEPLGHWFRRNNIWRAGLFGALAGIFSVGVAGGVFAGSLHTRRSRAFARLVIDGMGAGAWVATSESDGGVPWEFIGARDVLKSMAGNWDRHADLEFRAGADITDALDDAQLAEELGRIGQGPEDRWVQMGPVGARAMTVRIDRETRSTGARVLAAKVPHGSSRRRAALLEIGWVIEAEPATGTRYYVRRFPVSEGGDIGPAISHIRSAYRALYGEQMRFERWWLNSGRTGTMRIDL